MQLFLAIWGAVLSTLLAIVKIVEFRYGQAALLHVDIHYNRENEVLSIEVTNLGKRLVRVRSVSILFGNADARLQICTTRHEQLLTEGESFVESFARVDLVDNARRLGLKPGRDSVLFAQIELTGRPAALRVVSLRNLESEIDSKYARFIAANMFLGLEPLAPARIPWRVLK
jgi:hypothetical protein